MVTFEEDISTAFSDFRRVTGELFRAAGVAPDSPGEAARRLGLSRNLTWKFSRVMSDHDAFSALQHLPGDEGMEILAGAMGKAGVPRDMVASFAAARKRLEDVIVRHTGDRGTFELMLDSMAGAGSAERLEQSRKLAFRGNSGVWGLQARVRTTTAFVAPARDHSEMMDLAIIGGVVDFRRLRPGIRWPLFRPRQYHDDGTPVNLGAQGPKEEAIDPGSSGPETPLLIREFCSANMPPIRAVKSRLGYDYELGDGPVGNLGAFTCYQGRLVRDAEFVYRTGTDRYLDLLSHVTMPAETMLFDMVVHRSLAFLQEPKVLLMASADGVGPGREEQTVPLESKLVEVTGTPAVVSTSAVDRYGDVVSMVFARCGWAAREFRVKRLMIKYPPMHSVAVLRSVLPEKG